MLPPAPPGVTSYTMDQLRAGHLRMNMFLNKRQKNTVGEVLVKIIMIIAAIIILATQENYSNYYYYNYFARD